MLTPTLIQKGRYQMDEKVFQWQEFTGEAVTAGDVTVTPQSWALSIRLPFGGLVWNRPTAVLVSQNGRSRRIPVVDVTRIVVLAAVVMGTAVTILTWRKGAK